MPPDLTVEPSRSYSPHIQMVPVSLWRMNLRALATQTEWKHLRTKLLDLQGTICSGCGKVETATRRVYAHEEWEYFERVRSGTARLSSISLVCWHCHACEHWGCTNALVARGSLTRRAIDDTIAHFCRLNQVNEDGFRAHEAIAYTDWQRRSQMAWTIDYGIAEGWAVTNYERDPLNAKNWAQLQQKRWRDQTQLDLQDIVAT